MTYNVIMNKLPPRQRLVLAYWNEYLEETGTEPTHRQIAHDLRLPSRQSAGGTVKLLKEKGLIK